MPERSPRRLQRLAEELEEIGLPPHGSDELRAMLLEEIDHALRPVAHERRIASSGTIVEPQGDADGWANRTQLEIAVTPVVGHSLTASRRYADGLASWLLRRADGRDEWVLFDRPAGSERDLVVLAGAMDATIVQRHPSGTIRVVGGFGVLRWEGYTWHHEPPVATWIGTVTSGTFTGDPKVMEAMLEFAVHDLGSVGIGALLIFRPDGQPGPVVEERLATPPPLHVRNASHLAPLRHALGQIDGAAVFDADGILRQLGVRLVPSLTAEEAVDALGGTRHTSARRYSYDDPSATVVAVSEDGPVSVLRGGAVLGRSPTDD
jgi:DisA bacterial checkpoint controller nucleotide-binding